MTPSQLDRRITVKTRGVHLDALGSKTMVFTELGKFWAHVNFQKTGSDQMQDGKMMGTYQAATFTVRYNRKIEAGDRVTYKGENYLIENILEHGRRSYMELLCTTVNE
jgi:SPP1 family predicted phage head-tail adaptor